MKWKMIIALCVLVIISFVGTTQSEVLGEHSYKICLDECCKDNLTASYPTYNGGALDRKYVSYDWIFIDDCKNDKACAECLDVCMNELRKNDPETANKLKEIEVVANTPTSCFINTVTWGELK